MFFDPNKLLRCCLSYLFEFKGLYIVWFWSFGLTGSIWSILTFRGLSSSSKDDDGLFNFVLLSVKATCFFIYLIDCYSSKSSFSSISPSSSSTISSVNKFWRASWSLGKLLRSSSPEFRMLGSVSIGSVYSTSYCLLRSSSSKYSYLLSTSSSYSLIFSRLAIGPWIHCLSRLRAFALAL